MANFIVRKPYDSVEVKSHPCGSVCEKRYRLSRDKNMNAIYTEVDEINVSDYVGSFEAGASLSNLLSRCSLMPLRDKIAYLQQSGVGQSVDLASLPTDLTAAFIQANNLAKSDPDLFKRIKTGESFESIIKSIITPKADPAPDPTPDPTPIMED